MFYLIKFTFPKNAPKRHAFIVLTSFLHDALRQSARLRKFEMIFFCTTLVKLVKSVYERMLYFRIKILRRLQILRETTRKQKCLNGTAERGVFQFSSKYRNVGTILFAIFIFFFSKALF